MAVMVEISVGLRKESGVNDLKGCELGVLGIEEEDLMGK